VQWFLLAGTTTLWKVLLLIFTIALLLVFTTTNLHY
jgi:hypothetical protein